MVNWTDIHQGFGEEWYDGKTYQQTWEEKGFTYQDAQEWIQIGFKPNNYKKVKEWKNHAFTSQQTQSWIKKDLTPQDAEFAAYLRGKGYQPHQDLNLEELKKEFHTWLEKNKPTQEYLDIIYPLEQRNTVKKLDVSLKSLTGSLDLSDFTNLEELNCEYNQLTSLDLTNCLKLKELWCNNNNLSDLILPSSATKQLVGLDIRDNNFSGDLSLFSHLVNLERLNIDDNYFTGSLKPLQNLTKLRRLDIRDTDIDSGLEYLPDSLEYFACSVKWREDAKCKTIYNLFANDQGKVEKDLNGYIINFPQKFQEYKQWINLNFTEQEINQWIIAGLTLSDYNFAEYLKLKGHQPNQNLDLTQLKKEHQEELKNHKRIWEREMPDNATLLKRWKKAKLPKLNQAKLQEQFKLLQEQKEKLLQRINDLETLTQESERLIKEQKAKIVNNHYQSFTEEEKLALQELIKIHRTYEEAKRLKEETNKLFEQFYAIRQKLKDKLGEEFIEAVQSVLTDLEELYQREWDLTKQLQEKEQIPSNLKAIEKGIAEINKNIKAIETNPNQVVNNYITTGDINVAQGHALIGNNFGDQINLSQYATTIEEEEEVEFEAKILQPTYNTPSSSKK